MRQSVQNFTHRAGNFSKTEVSTVHTAQCFSPIIDDETLIQPVLRSHVNFSRQTNLRGYSAYTFKNNTFWCTSGSSKKQWDAAPSPATLDSTTDFVYKLGLKRTPPFSFSRKAKIRSLFAKFLFVKFFAFAKVLCN
jgi:hypothetical protein